MKVTKQDLREIMCNAWNFFNKTRQEFANCLKRAWSCYRSKKIPSNKVKSNYMSISKECFQAVKENSGDITKIIVSDDVKIGSAVIEVDINKLLHVAVMSELMRNGVIAHNSADNPNYENGVNVDFTGLEVKVVGKQMTIKSKRTTKASERFADSVIKFIK